MMATLTRAGNEQGLAVLAAGAALALQARTGLPWPMPMPDGPGCASAWNSGRNDDPRDGRRRIGAHTSSSSDAVDTASRLEDEAPEDGLLIGAETRRRAPRGPPASRRSRTCASREGQHRRGVATCTRYRTRGRRRWLGRQAAAAPTVEAAERTPRSV